jgi:hypothetical protein
MISMGPGETHDHISKKKIPTFTGFGNYAPSDINRVVDAAYCCQTSAVSAWTNDSGLERHGRQ